MDKLISQLVKAQIINQTDLIPIEQSGSTTAKGMTVAQLTTGVKSGMGVGQAGGIAQLDANGLVPKTQVDYTGLATITDLNGFAPINGASNALESAFVNIKTLSLGILSNGRMTNIGSADTNASYKKTDFIPVHPTWILNANRTKDTNSWHIMYDEFQNALGRLNLALGIDTSLHPKTRFIRFSDLNGYMTAVTITVKESMGLDLGRKLYETELKKVNEQSAVDNYFNWEENIPNATVTSTGAISANAGGLRTTPFMKLKEGHSGWLVVAPIYNSINPWALVFYDAAGVFISSISIPSGGSVIPLFGPQWRYGEVQIPAQAVYFRLRWDHRAENTDLQLQSLRIIDREAWRIFLSTSFFRGEINSARVRDIILGDKVINNSLANKFVCKLGDSITANNISQGSWNIWFNGALNPQSLTSRASGGATLTSKFVGFGQDYLNDGNTFMRQCETVYRDIAAGTIAPPDIVIIMGGTNDFDNNNPTSFVTPTEQGSLPYDEYMEQTFLTNAPAYNTLKPLADVSRTKVAGAIRYIVERLGTISPNTVFIVCTPIQSTLHSQLNAQRVVRDIKWIAGRLCIPVIDQWHASGMTPLWDYGTDRRFLADRIHPFSDSGQARGSAVMGRFIVNEFLKIFIPNV